MGTEAGVRRAVERLAWHGVCLSDDVGGRIVYSLNYDHVLYDAVNELLNADRELVRRLRKTLTVWEPAPVSAVLFGSAARRDGDADSDVDLLLIRPALATELRKREWARQVHELRNAVMRWTGNRLQVIDWTRVLLKRRAHAGEALVGDVLSEGLLVYGERPSTLLEGSA